jgi:hypothetical protein
MKRLLVLFVALSTPALPALAARLPHAMDPVERMNRPVHISPSVDHAKTVASRRARPRKTFVAPQRTPPFHPWVLGH